MRMVQSMNLQSIYCETTAQLWSPQVYLTEESGDLVLHIDDAHLRLNLAFSGYPAFIQFIDLLTECCTERHASEQAAPPAPSTPNPSQKPTR